MVLGRCHCKRLTDAEVLALLLGFETVEIEDCFVGLAWESVVSGLSD